MYGQNTLLKIKLIKVVLVSCLALTSIAINALETDFNKNIIIDAKKQKLDIKTNTLTFSGDVDVSQGSLRMKADRLEVIKAKDNSDSQDILIATGKPATYKQQLENGEVLTASAKNIEYKVSDRILTLSGNAKISQQGSEVSGDKIEYNLVEQKLIASSAGQKGQKVRTVLTPKSDEEEEQ